MTMMTETGRHGFDFWRGTWEGRNRKLVDVSDPECAEWIEFDGVCVGWETLGGLGNVETFTAMDMPGRGRVDGMSVRLYNPGTDTWRIWWVSSGDPGDIGVPVEGKWVGDRGDFFADDELNGRAIKVHYEWTRRSPTRARWRQFFSFDKGESWVHNWTVEHTKVTA